MLVFGDLANLPDSPPDANDYREQILAAEEEAKAKPGTPSGVPAAPSVPGLPGVPAFPGMGPKFAPGTKVRDKLSGQTGSVVEAPGGGGLDYGDVVFVKTDAEL